MKYYDDLTTSIFDFFDSNRTRKWTLDELKDLFCINENEEKVFEASLLKLQLDEKIILKNDYYMVFPYDSDLRVGKIKYKDETYYINLGNRKLIVPDKFVNNAINGDHVLYELKRMYNGTCYAKVKDIIYRQTDEIIFDCEIKNNKLKLIPYSTNFNYDVKLSSSDTKNLVDGERVLIKLKEFDGDSYTGYIVDYIGHRDDPNLFIKTLAAEHNVSIDFPKEVVNEVKKIPQEVHEYELKDRIDYRNKQIFTIDGKNTKDMDDAISLEINEKGNYVLGVYIADVAHYVKSGSAIYNNAKLRGNSYYPANFVIPMLHHLLSNGICSLNEGIDRLTLSCIMEINPNGKVVDFKIEESVINSNMKMNYDDVNSVLKGNMVPGYEDYYDTLKNMEKLHHILDKNKKKRGYINFGDNDIDSKMENGNVHINIPKRDTAEKLIEDFMLLANETVATYVFNMSLPFLYRCHDKPDKKRLKDVITELQEMGYDIKIHKPLDDNYGIQDILKQLEQYEEYPILAEKILQGIKRAIYTPDNIGHFGLALKLYTHFTSPIRRFIDLEVHTLLKDYIKGKYPENLDKLYEELVEISKHCNVTTKQSDELERDVNNKLMVMYMEQHQQDIFNVIICSITRNYLTVKTDNDIYGKINVKDLDGKYKFDEKNRVLYGNSVTLRVGDKIDVMFKETENDKIKFASPTTFITRVRK